MLATVIISCRLETTLHCLIVDLIILWYQQRLSSELYNRLRLIQTMLLANLSMITILWQRHFKENKVEFLQSRDVYHSEIYCECLLICYLIHEILIRQDV